MQMRRLHWIAGIGGIVAIGLVAYVLRIDLQKSSAPDPHSEVSELARRTRSYVLDNLTNDASRLPLDYFQGEYKALAFATLFESQPDCGPVPRYALVTTPALFI